MSKDETNGSTLHNPTNTMSICDSKSETSVVDQKAVAHPLWVMFVHLSIRLYLSVHLGHIGQFRHRSKEGGCQRILRS